MIRNSDGYINRCQYWSVNEPPLCKYWDKDNTICTFTSDLGKLPSYYPYCNIIGTRASCSEYTPSVTGDSGEITLTPMCVLPDQTRHVCNRATGKKWVVTLSGTGNFNEDSVEILDWDFSPINGYNDGACDGAGVNTSCSGYASRHLGFGIVVPSNSDRIDTFETGIYSTVADFKYTLPTNYVVYNHRARLSKCFWWKGDMTKYIVDDAGKVYLDGDWLCECEKDTSDYSESSNEFGPACNGCKPECKQYTGVCWKYCVDEKMQSGDPVLAEQVLELRYYQKENNWTQELIEKYYPDGGNIYTFDGEKYLDDDSMSSSLVGKVSTVVGDDNKISHYEISSNRVYMDSFETLSIKSEHLVMSEGTEVKGKLTNYPTLIKEIELLQLCPIIKNKFTSVTNPDGKKEEIFESKNLNADDYICIYGKTFYACDTFAINISDMELRRILPDELYYFGSMLDVRLGIGDIAYNTFYDKLTSIIKVLRITAPEYIYSSNISPEELSFLIDVPTFYKNRVYDSTNVNEIIVIQDTEDGIVYTKKAFKKCFVGGIINQTEFTIGNEEQSGALRRLFDYERDFFANVNHNGILKFGFNGLSNDSLPIKASHFYNDYNAGALASPGIFDTSTQYRGYKEYKITNTDYPLSMEDSVDENGKVVKKEFEVIGNNGMILINLDHPYLNSIFKPWEFESIIVEIFKEDEDPVECEMDLVVHGSTGKIGHQQLIMKPKKMADFSTICEGSSIITIKDLLYYDKRSFGDDPYLHGDEVSEVQEPPAGSMTTYAYISDSMIATYDKEILTIEDFTFRLVPSVIIKNREGKPFTQFRTKAIGWVKQPACPDVEIRYSWSANYVHYENAPACTCWGKWSEVNPKPAGNGLEPPCGDHDIGYFTKVGPMWWPYNMCEEFMAYNIIGNQNYYSVDIIGLFKYNKGEEKVHGAHDMRMLGPHTNYAYNDRGCNFLLRCACDFRTINMRKSSNDNVFVGRAAVRSFVGDGTLAMWEAEGEQTPLFGNEPRPMLKSYRTMDRIQFYTYKNGDPSVEIGMVPIPMSYSDTDITTTGDYVWNMYGSTEGPNVYNPMGLYIATGKLDPGSTIDESIDYYNRFNFDQVFNCRHSSFIEYPSTVGKYAVSTDDGKYAAWYEFKRYAVAASDDYIQWAWREIWKPLCRNTKTDDVEQGPNVNALSSFIMEYMEKKEEGTYIKGAFVSTDGSYATGMFETLQINYSPYLYDVSVREFTTIVNEGPHKIRFTPPKKDENTGEYGDEDNKFCTFQVDNGPVRAIDWTGKWMDDPEYDDLYNTKLYKKCTGDEAVEEKEDQKYKEEWIKDVTLFGTGYDSDSESVAEDEDRMAKTFTLDEAGDSIELRQYFQRGLNVVVSTNKLNKLPLSLKSIGDQFTLVGYVPGTDMIFGGTSSGTGGDTDTYVQQSQYMFDERLCTVGRVGMSIHFGRKVDPEGGDLPILYHIPNIKISNLSGKVIFERAGELATLDTLFEIKSFDFEWENLWDYIVNGDKGVTIDFSLVLPEDEATWKQINMSNVSRIEIFEEYLINAEEDLYLWERKYYVSHGKSGSSPPQGVGDESALRVLTGNRDTVWMNDTHDGTENIPGSSGNMYYTSKVRGKAVYNTYEDNFPVTGDLSYMELKQKELYNEAISDDFSTAVLHGVVPPSLKDVLVAIGVPSFSVPPLVLTNHLIQDISNINKPPPMNGEGHLFLPSDPYEALCFDKQYHDDVFDYQYVCQDPDGAQNIASYDASYLYYWGTWLAIQRRELAEIMMTSYAKNYGADTTNRTFLDDNTELVFPYRYPRNGGSVNSDYVPIMPDPDLMVKNWTNVFFGGDGISLY